MARRLWQPCLPCLAVLAAIGRAQLPYRPARILRASEDDDAAGLLYLFLPSTSGSGFRLVALNASTTLDASNVQYTTISPSLPFLDGASDVAFTPVIDTEGKISVYAGDCASGTTEASLWQFSPSLDDGGRSGDWNRVSVREVDGMAYDTWSGPNYLAAGISFSNDVGSAAESKVYIFGGMCPINSASAETWVASANYSDTMLVLSPTLPAQDPPSSSPEVSGYDLAVTKSKGPPVAEAGYSLTALQPSFLNTSEALTRNQNFILLGGHTRQAFINMSQVALFSLPEETWSFPTIDPPLPPVKSDLAVRQELPPVDSRSGHTAVMTDDGKRVVVLGGWVGDINTPAIPQLLILELGDGYGGTGNWKWTTPVLSGPGPSDGTGIYGHGAIMLPGDVVMAVGGYTIAGPQGSKVKRSGPEPNTKTYLLNVTSNSWISTYRPPANLASQGRASQAGRTGGLSSSSKKAALGSGLALGLSAIIGALIVWLWYSRRLRKRREAREKELQQLGLAAHRDSPFDSDGGRYDPGDNEKLGYDRIGTRGPVQGDNPYPWAPEDPSALGRHPGWRPNRGTDAERTGLLVEIPSPTRGLRRSLHTRGRSGDRLLSYQLAPGKEDVRRSFTGDIHPIDERDELEVPAQAEGTLAETETADNKLVSLTPAQTPDPFRDPGPLGGHSPDSDGPTPSPARERELEIQEWTKDWAAADAYMRGSAGPRSPDRSSPEKETRTSSNLSERSLRSAASSHSQQMSIGNMSRTMSQRSAGRLLTAGSGNSGPLRSSSVSSTYATPAGNISPGLSSSRRSLSLRLFTRQNSDGLPSTRPNSMDFTQLQIEGEALLPRPQTGGSLREGGTSGKSRAAGWLGSVRRALPFVGGGNNEPNGSPEEQSASSSPIKSRHHSRLLDDSDVGLRRAASAGAAYWRTKQGAADWGATTASGGAGPSNSGNGGEDATGVEHLDDDEWDVEAAVERRVVQVMFTVPKEKLRVVNAGEEMSLLSETDKEDMAAATADEGAAVDETGKAKGKGKARADPETIFEPPNNRGEGDGSHAAGPATQGLS